MDMLRLANIGPREAYPSWQAARRPSSRRFSRTSLSRPCAPSYLTAPWNSTITPSSSRRKVDAGQAAAVQADLRLLPRLG